MSEIALRFSDIKKTYPPKVKALKGLTLEVYRGEIFGLLGPNGAGKSTLINILTTLTNKSEGEIEVLGVNHAERPFEAKTYLGVVPQEFNFNFFEKVYDIVVQQAGFYGVSEDIAAKRAEKYLKRLGLWDKRDTQAMHLSGGMKRRLMIVRALIHDPEILILDEPSAGVDVELRREMWDFIQEIHKAGKTIILTTHYLEEAENLCTRVGIIAQGKLLQVGTVKELLAELQKDRIVLDVEGDIGRLPNRYESIDKNTVETDFLKGEDLYQIISDLHERGVKVTGIRNKSNRLEEVFLSKIVKK